MFNCIHIKELSKINPWQFSYSIFEFFWRSLKKLSIFFFSIGNSEIVLMSDIPTWAMVPTKPTYTAAEVGARPNTWIPSQTDIGIKTETWKFALEDGTVVHKEVHVG